MIKMIKIANIAMRDGTTRFARRDAARRQRICKNHVKYIPVFGRRMRMYLDGKVLRAKTDMNLQVIDFSPVRDIFHDFSAFFTLFFSCKDLIFRRLGK